MTSDPGLLFQAVDAFADLAEALVIGLNDLQWADSSSVLALGALARRIAGCRWPCSAARARCRATLTWTG